MADTQATLYGQVYGRNIMQQAQQKYSKLLNTVYIKPNVKGKTFFQDQIGEWSMQTKGGRNVQTPNNDPNLARRMGVMVDYHDNRMLDRGDELKYISDPRSAYTIAAARSLGRKIDDVILASIVGTANTGETGSGTASTPSTVTITSGSITLAEVATLKKALDDNNVEEEDRYLVLDTTAMSAAVQEEKMSSADYATVKALVRGDIDSFMGFKWIWTTRLSTAESALKGVAYQKYGICMAMASQPLVRTDERSDLSYSWQVYYELNVGAVRLEENRIRVIKNA